MGGEGVANGEGSPIYDGHDPLSYHLDRLLWGVPYCLPQGIPLRSANAVNSSGEKCSVSRASSKELDGIFTRVFRHIYPPEGLMLMTLLASVEAR